MSDILSLRVGKGIKNRLATFAQERAMTHPSRQPNLSAAARQIMTAGLEALEAAENGSEPELSERERTLRRLGVGIGEETRD